jgi:hypothetical protein
MRHNQQTILNTSVVIRRAGELLTQVEPGKT